MAQQECPNDALKPAGWLRTVKTSHSVVVVDYRTGTVSLLVGDAMQVWLACVQGSQLAEVDSPPVRSAIAGFVGRGWLTRSSAAGTPGVVVELKDPEVSWGTQE